MKDDHLPLLYQIVAARTRCKVSGDTLYVLAPSLEVKCTAQEIHNDILVDAELQGVYTDADVFNMLVNNNLWTPEEEERLNSSHIKVDALKEDMYLRFAAFQSKQVERDRHLLQRLRSDITLLFRRRHIYDSYTCQGLATLYHLHHILLHSTIKANGKPLSETYVDDFYMRFLAEDFVNHKPSEATIRNLAQSDTWKSIWWASKAGQAVFGVPAILFTDEQRSLISWSRLYDNVLESLECPPKEVIADDDLLDGWLINQHKKREAEKNKDDGGRRNAANEMFIPAETKDDARRVSALNDPSALITKQQRMTLIRKKGAVSEEKMPDSQQQLLLQATEAFRERMKRR